MIILKIALGILLGYLLILMFPALLVLSILVIPVGIILTILFFAFKLSFWLGLLLTLLIYYYFSHA